MSSAPDSWRRTAVTRFDAGDLLAENPADPLVPQLNCSSEFFYHKPLSRSRKVLRLCIQSRLSEKTAR